MNIGKIFDTNLVMAGVKAGAGFAAGSMITKAVPLSGPISAIIPFIGAGIVSGMLGKSGKEVAAGMATFGAINALRTFAPSVSQTVGLGYLPGSQVNVNRLAGGYRLNGTQMEYNEMDNLTVR